VHAHLRAHLRVSPFLTVPQTSAACNPLLYADKLAAPDQLPLLDVVL
jgi:hypothetical protein